MIGQPSGPPSQYSERHGPHSQQEAVIDLVMSSPTLDSQLPPSQTQENYPPQQQQQQQHRQVRPMNGESDHGQATMISPDTSPRVDRGVADRSTKLDASEASSTYGQGGLVAAVSETGTRTERSDKTDRTEGFRMETGVAGLKEKYHPLRTGDMGKANLATEHSAEETMGPDPLPAELRINEPRYVDSN